MGSCTLRKRSTLKPNSKHPRPPRHSIHYVHGTTRSHRWNCARSPGSHPRISLLDRTPMDHPRHRDDRPLSHGLHPISTTNTPTTPGVLHGAPPVPPAQKSTHHSSASYTLGGGLRIGNLVPLQRILTNDTGRVWHPPSGEEPDAPRLDDDRESETYVIRRTSPDAVPDRTSPQISPCKRETCKGK